MNVYEEPVEFLAYANKPAKISYINEVYLFIKNFQLLWTG